MNNLERDTDMSPNYKKSESKVINMFQVANAETGKTDNYAICEKPEKSIPLSYETSNRMKEGSRILELGDGYFWLFYHNTRGDPPSVDISLITCEKLE